MREYLVTVDPDVTDPERAESVTCLAFEPTIPSKVGEEEELVETLFHGVHIFTSKEKMKTNIKLIED